MSFGAKIVSNSYSLFDEFVIQAKLCLFYFESITLPTTSQFQLEIFWHRQVGDNSYNTSAKGLDGLGRKMAIFAHLQYCTYTDVVGGSEKDQNYADIIQGWSLALFIFNEAENQLSQNGVILTHYISVQQFLACVSASQLAQGFKGQEAWHLHITLSDFDKFRPGVFSKQKFIIYKLAAPFVKGQ